MLLRLYNEITQRRCNLQASQRTQKGRTQSNLISIIFLHAEHAMINNTDCKCRRQTSECQSRLEKKNNDHRLTMSREDVIIKRSGKQESLWQQQEVDKKNNCSMTLNFQLKILHSLQ